MKKIPNNESIMVSPVKMHWDDLQEIEARIANGREVKVESGEYSYDNLDELRRKTKKSYINRMTIIGHSKEKYNNRIKVDIDPSRVWIYQDSESTETAAKIKDLLTKFSPWYMYSPVWSPAWQMLTGILGWTPVWATLLLSSQLENIYLKLIMVLVGVTIALWGFKSEPLFGGTKIFTSLKNEKLNFWERNKDDFLRDLIIGLILLIIGFLLGHFFSK